MAILAVTIKMDTEYRPKIPISADWILKRIQEGKKVRLKNAIIEDDLDLNKLDLLIEHLDRTKSQKLRGFEEDVKMVQSSIRMTNSTIQGRLYFGIVTFSGGAWFDGATFSGDTGFQGATFSGDTGFQGATFSGDAGFDGTKFEGDVLTFRNSTFTLAQSQEDACRRAKNVLERNGDREEAGYHFYREMEGKRKQKESDYRYFDYEALLVCREIDTSPKELKDFFIYLRYNILEYLVFQVIFGYGVHPLRLWGFWWLFVAFFAILYWMGGGINNSTTAQPVTDFLENLWFSITVAVTPGFAGYKPDPWFYQVLAGVEAIFGTFMWAAFITTFAKKFMR